MLLKNQPRGRHYRCGTATIRKGPQLWCSDSVVHRLLKLAAPQRLLQVAATHQLCLTVSELWILHGGKQVQAIGVRASRSPGTGLNFDKHHQGGTVPGSAWYAALQGMSPDIPYRSCDCCPALAASSAAAGCCAIQCHRVPLSSLIELDSLQPLHVAHAGGSWYCLKASRGLQPVHSCRLLTNDVEGYDAFCEQQARMISLR